MKARTRLFLLVALPSLFIANSAMAETNAQVNKTQDNLKKKEQLRAQQKNFEAVKPTTPSNNRNNNAAGGGRRGRH